MDNHLTESAERNAHGLLRVVASDREPTRGDVNSTRVVDHVESATLLDGDRVNVRKGNVVVRSSGDGLGASAEVHDLPLTRLDIGIPFPTTRTIRGLVRGVNSQNPSPPVTGLHL